MVLRTHLQYRCQAVRQHAFAGMEVLGSSVETQMVLPITNPGSRTSSFSVNGPFAGSWSREQAVRWRQKPPFNLNLPYRSHYASTMVYTTWRWPNPFGQVMNWAVGYSPSYRRSEKYYSSSSVVRELETRLAGKLQADFRSTAGVGVTLVEGHQAFTMITNRLIQIGRFARALKRLDFRAASWILKNPGKQAPRPKDLEKLILPTGLKARKGASAFANNFLEFHFGWDPLIGDIQDAMTVLDAPIPYGKYQVKSGFKHPIQFTNVDSVGSMWNGLTRSFTEHTLYVYGKAGCEVEVTNPNLALASNMGLTTPWSLLWEVIPFSFVVDWFYNVGSYLEQFEVGHPFEYRNPWYSWVVIDNAELLGEYFYRNAQYDKVMCVTQMRSFGRETVMPSVRLHRKRVPLFEGKLRRALAASSLLIQGMKYR